MNYSKIAKSYNSLYKEEQLKKLKIIKRLLKIKKQDLLLDIGCGTGISTEFFKEDCNPKGIDPCKELIEQSNLNLIQAKAEKIPFKDNYFDIVISVTAIHNFNNIEKGIKEIKRVLKNKEQFCFSILKRSKHLPKIKKLIQENFTIKKQREEDKDIIFYGLNYINA